MSYNKYLKYKTKYLNLKKIIENEELNSNSIPKSELLESESAPEPEPEPAQKGGSIDLPTEFTESPKSSEIYLYEKPVNPLSNQLKMYLNSSGGAIKKESDTNPDSDSEFDSSDSDLSSNSDSLSDSDEMLSLSN
jgi:hypothetical protein